MKGLELSCALKASRGNFILNRLEYKTQANMELSWMLCSTSMSKDTSLLLQFDQIIPLKFNEHQNLSFNGC